VTLTYATGRGHALIGRALYLPEGCAADEEHRGFSLSQTSPAARQMPVGVRARLIAGPAPVGSSTNTRTKPPDAGP
jgi:hypothetical protein